MNLRNIYQSLSSLQTCEIKAEGGKRFLTLHKVKLEQAGEVLYQALNAVTTAILTVKGTMCCEMRLNMNFKRVLSMDTNNVFCFVSRN